MSNNIDCKHGLRNANKDNRNAKKDNRNAKKENGTQIRSKIPPRNVVYDRNPVLSRGPELSGSGHNKKSGPLFIRLKAFSTIQCNRPSTLSIALVSLFLLPSAMVMLMISVFIPLPKSFGFHPLHIHTTTTWCTSRIQTSETPALAMRTKEKSPGHASMCLH